MSDVIVQWAITELISFQRVKLIWWNDMYNAHYEFEFIKWAYFITCFYVWCGP